MCVLINTTCLPVSRLSPSTSLPRWHHVTGSTLCLADVGEQLLSCVSTCNITCSSLLSADQGERVLCSVSVYYLLLSAFSWPRWTIAFQCFSVLLVPLCFQPYYLFLSAFSWPRWTIAFPCFSVLPVPLCFQMTQVNDCFPVFQHITCSSLSWCRWTIAFHCFNTSVPLLLSADPGERSHGWVHTEHLAQLTKCSVAAHAPTTPGHPAGLLARVPEDEGQHHSTQRTRRPAGIRAERNQVGPPIPGLVFQLPWSWRRQQTWSLVWSGWILDT